MVILGLVILGMVHSSCSPFREWSVLGMVGSRNGRVRNGRVLNGRVRKGRSRIAHSRIVRSRIVRSRIGTSTDIINGPSVGFFFSSLTCLNTPLSTFHKMTDEVMQLPVFLRCFSSSSKQAHA